MVASKRSGPRRSIRSQPDPQTVTRDRNRRAIRILERDPAGVVEAAFRGDVARRLGELGAPAALVGTLLQAATAPVEWRALPVWTRGPDGVQAVIPRVLVGNLVMTVMVRAGDPQWTGEQRPKGGGPDVTAGQIVGEVEETGDPLSTVIGEWLKSTPAGDVSALTAVVEAAGLTDLEARPNVLIGASLSGEVAPDDEAEFLGLGAAPEDEDPASLFALAPGDDRLVLVPSYLLQTYDMSGGPLVSRGRGGPAPVRQRLWLYGLTVLATGDRTGDMRRFRVPAGSVIDAIWPYGWDYQRSSWPALFNAFEAINRQRLAYRDRLGVEHALHAVLFADYPQRAPSPAALRSAIIRGRCDVAGGCRQGAGSLARCPATRGDDQRTGATVHGGVGFLPWALLLVEEPARAATLDGSDATSRACRRGGAVPGRAGRDHSRQARPADPAVHESARRLPGRGRATGAEEAGGEGPQPCNGQGAGLDAE